MVEQEKLQSKANCPERGKSKRDTGVETKERPRKRHDHKAGQPVEEHTHWST